MTDDADAGMDGRSIKSRFFHPPFREVAGRTADWLAVRWKWREQFVDVRA